MSYWPFILSKPQDKSSKFAERVERAIWAFEFFGFTKAVSG